MASTNIKSIRVWQESAFGSLQANGDPTTTIPGSAVAVDAQRAEITSYGEVASNERDTVRWGPFDIAPDPETVPGSSGALINRRTGEVSIVLPGLMGLGTTDPDDNPLVWMLASSFADSGTPDIASEEAVADAETQTFGVDDETAYPPGLLIQATGQQVAAQFSAVVDATTVDHVEHSPAFSSEVDADVVRLCRTFGSTLGAPGSVLGPSLAFCADFAGGRTFATGCRLSNITLGGTGRRVDATTLTFTAALIYDDHSNSNGDVLPFRAAGAHVLHTLHADPVLSNAINEADEAYPRIAGRISLPIDEWSISCAPQLTPLSDWRTVLGMSDMEVTGYETEVSITLATPNANLANDFKNRVQRQLMIPFGPPGVGNGAAVFLPGAIITSDPNVRNTSGQIVRQTLTYRPGRWSGDVGTGNLKNSPFRIGFSR